jgi:hypothetical protein
MISPIAALTFAFALLAATPGRATPQPPRACCSITAVDVRAGVASAKDPSGNVFEFTARNASTLAALRVGQAVHANFARNQVSLDGKTVCCTITKAPAPAVTVRQPPAGAPAPTPSGNTPPLVAGGARASVAVPPAIAFGTPIPHNPTTKRAAELGYAQIPATRFQTRTITASLGGRTLNKTVVHLYGLEGIENAPSSVPDGVRRLLEIHARKTPQGEQTHYIVDPQITQAWITANPVPEDVKVRSGGKCKGNEWERFRCRTEKSWDNWTELTSEEWERLRKRAQGWWDDDVKKVGQCLTNADGWKDHVATGPSAPVPVSVAPEMSVDLEKSVSKGAAKGTVRGSVGLGFPMEGEFQAGITFFYIPCLPGVYRLRGLTADGTLTVGNQVSVDVSATGEFDKRFTVPPGGGLQYPLYVIPVMIGQVPVAVIDVSVYVEGDVKVSADGKATGRFAVTNSQRTAFQFDCSGKGCTGKRRSTPLPTTTNESAQIEGQVQVQPGIYTALQLSFDYNVLQGRAGPEPFLLGIANGCGAVSATQTGGTSTTQTNAALTADLDWGIMLRAEALIAGQKVGDPWEDRAMQDRHLWFKDVAPGGSTALMPAVTGPAQGVAAQPVPIKVRMPSCYPYTDKVDYRVSWDGSGVPAPNAACDWQRRTCSSEPGKDLTLSFTWPTAGAYSVSVQLVKDAHRTFAPSPQPAKLNVTIGTTGGGTP